MNKQKGQKECPIHLKKFNFGHAEMVVKQAFVIVFGMYTRDRNVWGDRPFYLVKQPQEKWACDFHDDAPPLSFQLQVAEVIF